MSLKSDGARSLRPRVAEEAPKPRATDLALRLAEQVRQLRIQAALTQAELAARAGVTVETVARLERVLRGRLSANANPSLETMERIATALGVDVAELLSTPAKSKPRDDRLASVLRGVSAATRRRVIRVAEALVREDRVETKPALRRR
ncbi:MAG TPA: helix-turn-helix domain-containing protein [Polyangiaceae bacterium]|jgi:transcriptional regulator with XRE-family HTH domain|nr:helix-turn-helix domain-containing protein [Polyangiaceae bacterium]